MSADVIDTDIAIVGAGLAGLITALACATTGLSVTLIDGGTLSGRSDPRTSFLARSSLRMLNRLGVSLDSEPVRDILAAEGVPGQPVRSGALHFQSFDGPDEALGAVVANGDLHQALVDRVNNSAVKMIESIQVQSLTPDPGHAQLSTSGGPLTARLVIAADGRNSTLRRMSHIAVERHDYGQSALTCTLAHTTPHKGVAYQVFFPGGPLALLPLTGHRSSLVWTDRTDAIAAATALSPEQLLNELHYRLGDTLGTLSLEDTPQSYPLVQRLATALAADRLALVGDAAHVIHPLAGQGINLGFRDAAALADIVSEAHARGLDIGGASALDEYARWRSGDVRGMALATDALSHAYSLNGPIGGARRFVTSLIENSPLKAGLSREAAGERPNLPEMMR